MTRTNTILGQQAAPGGAPRGLEQPNGDLLLPAHVRPLLAQALQQVELALAIDRHGQLKTLNDAQRMLGIGQPQAKPAWTANLNRVRPL